MEISKNDMGFDRLPLSMLGRFCGLFAMSSGVFFWSRGMSPWPSTTPTPASVVAAYAGTGAIWAIALNGALQYRSLATAVAWMALAGLVVSTRSNSVPAWLIAVVLVTAAAALCWNLAFAATSMRRKRGPLHYRLRSGALKLVPNNVKQLAVKELQIWTAILRPSVLSRRITGERFFMGHSGSDVVAIRAVIGLGLIELSAVHLLLYSHYPTVAFILLGVSVVTLLYLFGIARSLRVLPTTIDGDVVTVRLGVLRSKMVALSAIEKGECREYGGDDDSMRLEFSIMDPPNVRLHLRTAIEDASLMRGVRQIKVIDFRLDEPVKFVALINALVDRSKRPED